MQTLDPGAATSLLVGTPASAPGARKVKRISACLAGMSDVLEAHLPAVQSIGSGDAPRLALVVVLTDIAGESSTRERIEPVLRSAFRERERPALMFITRDHPLLAAVRSADCVVGWRD